MPFLDLERKPAFEKLILSGDIQPGVAIDDGAAVHWVDGVASRIVSGADQASAYFVEARNGKVRSNEIYPVEKINLNKN